MTLYSKIQKELEQNPLYRERSCRDILFQKMLVEDYPWINKLPFKELVDFAKSYDTLRHEHDAVTRENPELRGKDYNDKKQLVQAKLQEFGYSPGFHGQVKQLKML